MQVADVIDDVESSAWVHLIADRLVDRTRMQTAQCWDR